MQFDKSPIDIALSNGRTDIAEMLQMTRVNFCALVHCKIICV